MSAISQRMHLVLLAAWTVLWFAVVQPNGGFSWHYLRTGGELIYAGPGRPDGGLNLYAHHPELQMGPVSFLAAGLFNPFPEAVGQFLAAAVMSLLGLVILVVAGRSAAWHFLGTGTNHQRLRQRVLIAGLAFIPMWIEVAVRFGHLDDVLALFFTALAVHALTRGNAAATGIFLALAMDSKPTALAFLPACGARLWSRSSGCRSSSVPRSRSPQPSSPSPTSPRPLCAGSASTTRKPLPGTGPHRRRWDWRWAASRSGGAAGLPSSCSAPTPGSSWTPASTRTTPPPSCWAHCSGTSSGSGAWCPGGAGSD